MADLSEKSETGGKSEEIKQTQNIIIANPFSWEVLFYGTRKWQEAFVSGFAD